MSEHAGALGRHVPPDWRHVETHHVNLLAPELRPTNQPVVLGIPWLTGMDKPIKGDDGRYRIHATGRVRGGHAICAEPAPEASIPGKELDVASWQVFYDQGETPACEGFSHARALTLSYREKFNPFWLYDDARRKEGTYPDGEGSTNRETCAALVSWGVHPETGSVAHAVPWLKNAGGHRIASYHWMTNADEVCAALGLPLGSEVPLLNSWGTAYPHRVYIDSEDVAKLLADEGEADVFLLA